jgi:hypothetical protein
MADTSLRIGIDSSPAEAGARRVIASLRQIQQEAARTVGITVPVKIDTAGIAAAVAQVNQALRGVSNSAINLNLPVNFDLAGIDRQTADLVNRIRTEIDRNVGNGVSVETSLKVVTDAAEAEILRVLSRDLPPAEATLEVATDTAESEIRRVLSQISGSVGVSIEVVSDEARTEIERFIAQSDVPVDILLDVLTSPAAAEITRFINADRPPVDVDVDVGSGAAEAEIDRLVSEMAQTVRVSLTADTAPAQAEIDQVLSASMRVIELLVEADTAAATRQVDRFLSDTDRTINASLDVSTDAAMAAINRVVGQDLPPTESVLTVDTRDAEAAVRQVRSAASDPVEVPLNVSIENAEARINQLLSDAQRSIDIAVNVSAGDADGEIDRILSGTSESIDIPLDVSTEEATAAVRRFAADSGRTVEVAVEVLTRAAEAEIARFLSRTRPPIEISLNAITAAAEAEINRVVSRAVNAVEILLTADTSAAEASIDATTSAIPPTVDIPVDADTSRAQAEIDRLGATIPPTVTIPVSVDGDDAKAEIDRLADTLGARLPQTPKVTVEADVSDVVAAADEAADALAGIDDAADLRGLNTSARQAATSLSAIEAAAKKASSAADDMGDAFKNATREVEALELVGEALLAISTSIIEAITSFEDLEDAVKAATGSAVAAEMAMAMLEEFALSTSVSIEDVTAAFVELRTNGLEASKDALTSYGNVAAGLNLTMEELAQAVGDAANRNFSKLNETQLKAKESGDQVIFTYHGMTTTVDNTSKAIAGFIKQMGNTEFAGSMIDAAGGVTGAFEAMSDAWNELARDMGEGGLSAGLEDFAHSMVRASEAADELGRILGSWLGNQASLLGRDIEGIVDQLNDLVDIFESVTDAINSIPSLSGVFDGAGDFMKRAVPALFAEGATPPAAPEQGPAENPDTVRSRAFGSDTNQPRKATRSSRPRKSDADRQSERFAQEDAENQAMIRTLNVMNDAYEHGRIVVDSTRNSIDELTASQAAQKSVGAENAKVLMDQWATMKGLQESIAIKGEVLGQQEAIMQTVALAEAYKEGSAAVDQAEASQKAWNTAVQLGVTGSPDLIAQFTELAAAAQVANDNLALEQDLSGMDQQIDAATRLGDAYRQGGAAIREATLEQEVYAAAAAVGKEHDEEAISRIREKMTVLRELSEARRADEQAMEAGFRLEEMEGELRISQMVGEARFIEAERLQMLTEKKRELRDATATLTAAEEQQAEAMGRARAAIEGQSTALENLANSIPNIAYAFEEATAGALMSFEDALVDIMMGSKSAKEAFADMAKAIAADLARMAIRMAIIQPLAMLFGGMMGGGAGMVASNVAVGATSTAFNLGGGGQQWHTGGVVGQDSAPFRPFSTFPKFHAGGIVGDQPDSPFAGMPRFHKGGLAANEVPAVLEKGEGVFTKAQMANLQPVNNNSTSAPVTINVSVQQTQGGDPGQAEHQGRIIAKQVEMAMGDYITRAQKPGGRLNPNGGY